MANLCVSNLFSATSNPSHDPQTPPHPHTAIPVLRWQNFFYLTHSINTLSFTLAQTSRLPSCMPLPNYLNYCPPRRYPWHTTYASPLSLSSDPPQSTICTPATSLTSTIARFYTAASSIRRVNTGSPFVPSIQIAETAHRQVPHRYLLYFVQSTYHNRTYMRNNQPGTTSALLLAEPNTLRAVSPYLLGKCTVPRC